MKNSEKLKILGINVNDLKFFFDCIRPTYSVCIASTGQIIDEGAIIDITDSSTIIDDFMEAWLNAESGIFKVSEDSIKEYVEKHKEMVDETCNNQKLFCDKTEQTNQAVFTIAMNNLVKQLQEQNKILRSIDKSLDKLVRKPIK